MIHFVIGTRAQLFKMAPIMLECQKRQLHWRWIYTAQHRDTMAESLKTFGLPQPDYIVFKWDSEAKTVGKVWYWFTRVLLKLFHSKEVLDGYTGPRHIVLTHGDTLTTWWAALLGRLKRCQVMHVESGLRSFNLFKPFPEEINRLMTFYLSTYYACPGQWALSNIRKHKGKKINTGHNTQIDTLRFGLEHCETAKLTIAKRKYVVASIHRYENIFNEKRLQTIIDRVEDISKEFAIYWVQHPATKAQLERLTAFKKRLENNKHIELLPRLEYLRFIKLVKHSQFVITDGGGNQEELYHMGKPTLLFRDETERKEGLNETALLSKLDKKLIKQFVGNYKAYRKEPFAATVSPSAIIADNLEDYGKD